MEEPQQLQIERFEQLPSALLFASQIEARNVPAVFCGCVKDWKAFVQWDPANGGLDYLQERVGSFVVEAMLSRSAPVFYGDIRSHERVPLPFSSFIGYCKHRMQNTDSIGGASFESERHKLAVSDAEQGTLLSGDASQQIYLAQVPIMNTEDQERVQLETLGEDIQTPAFLDAKELVSINLWMNNAHARSSTHYDPHHNLLCIVAGRKQVVLWPPSASPMLYPRPVYGEASNHSSVALENPDFSLYPRAKCSMELAQRVILQAGDALFIPEGWFHQVDSDDITIAVNFWWQSSIMSSMLGHMDAYYMRRILRRLTDKEMNMVLKASFPGMVKPKGTGELCNNGEADHGCYNLGQASERQDLQGKDQKQGTKLDELDPYALRAIHELVSSVHDHVNITDQSHFVKSTSANDAGVSMKAEYVKNSSANLFSLEDDLVAKLIWTLDPCTLKNTLLAMAHNFPRTLEALILQLLSPVGAEVLTRKFDEMDQQTTEEDRNKFYQVFYSAFDDQFAAMDVILSGKESFALQMDNKNLPFLPLDYSKNFRIRPKWALKNALDKFLGLKL